MPAILRPAAERGVTRIDWLDSRHSFAFGDYRDPAHVAFRTLRVLNDDRVAPAGGFGAHPHRDMEIITVVLSGELAHRDSLGTGSRIPAGDWQMMSAGSGVTHSEFNASDTEPVHFLQMWVAPNVRGAKPRYAQARPAGVADTFEVVLAPEGEVAAMPIRQDARVLNLAFSAGGTARHALAPGRGGYLHVATGSATVNGVPLSAGDGLKIEGDGAVEVTGTTPGVAVLFDLG